MGMIAKPLRRLNQQNQMSKIYEINDNATYPFVVFDYGGVNASIYNNRFNEVTNRGELKGKLMDVKYEQLFLGGQWNE